jgi:hypothetical protein
MYNIYPGVILSTKIIWFPFTATRGHFHMPRLLLSLFLLLLWGTTVYSQTPQALGEIQGMVLDTTTRSPLYGAGVNVTGTRIGVMTDKDGRYRLEGVSVGTHNVRFSMIGYKSLVRTDITVSPNRITELTVSLDVEAVEMESVTVTATESYFEKNPEAEVSGRTIDREEIMNAAGSAMDIQRVVQVLPSVTSGSDELNEIIVRGGNYGENLFLMDGIEIPNPNHFALQGAGGGPISLLRSEFIRDVNFLAGAFPARFGDKASSVLDISLRSGNRDRFLTNVDMGMAGAGFMAEGPVGDRGSFLLSGRKSFLDLIVSSIGMTAIPRYYNFQGKLTYSLGDNHTLLWNIVYGDDNIRIKPGEDVEEDDTQNVQQSTGLVVSGLTLQSSLSKSLYAETVLSFVRNHWDTDVWEEGTTRSQSTYNNHSIESEMTLKHELTWQVRG